MRYIYESNPKRTYIILIFSVLMAGKRVNMLIDEQATAHVPARTFLCMMKSRPYRIGQNAAPIKQTV